MEILMAIAAGGAGAAIVKGLFDLAHWFLNRKAQKEDSAKEVERINFAEIDRKLNVLFIADRTILYDRIKHLGKSYIARGYVTVEELEDLTRMHGVYHDKDKLNGNGFLDKLMETVNALPKRVN